MTDNQKDLFFFLKKKTPRLSKEQIDSRVEAADSTRSVETLDNKVFSKFFV